MTDSGEHEPMAASCEHYWASHIKGGFGLCVRICQLCHTVDWDDLLAELRHVYGAGPAAARSRRLQWGQSVARNASRVHAENTIPVFDGSDHIGDIELSDANAATLGAMLMDAATDNDGNVITVDIAIDTSGMPPPQVELPRLADALDDDVYDKIRARLAYLENWRVRQQHETGKLLGRLDEATMWARHGYEIGQRSCLWSDHGVAPAWLTEGLPAHDASACEHLNGAVAEYDLRIAAERKISRVRDLASVPLERVPETSQAHTLARMILAALDGDTPKETTT